MNLASMRYKDYVWPHNPKTCEITFERKIAVNKVPFGLYSMQSMGMTYRVLRGEGEFIGDGAYKEFKKLEAVFYDECPGILIHPVWQTSNAHFAALSLRQEPKEDFVSYTFEFWEDCSDYAKGLTLPKRNESPQHSGESVYVVISGDTMWDIARRHAVTLARLIELNPQIKNPNLIYPGDKITVA